MASAKTAISLPGPLLEEIEGLAHQMRTSRSRVFVIALEEFVRRRRNEQILRDLNDAYADPLDPVERKVLELGRKGHRKRLEGDR
jgi:predicted transcriptional regulator